MSFLYIEYYIYILEYLKYLDTLRRIQPNSPQLRQHIQQMQTSVLHFICLTRLYLSNACCTWCNSSFHFAST